MAAAEIAAMPEPADQASEISRFAAVLEAASPGPWHALPSADGRFRVEAPNEVIERDLSERYADYLVAIRTSADELMAMVRDSARLDARRARQLADIFAAKSRSVSPDWLFVAPRGGGDAWFMHNSGSMIGSAQLRKADADLIDEARTAIPLLLAHAGVAPAPAGALVLSRRPIVIPGRAPDHDAITEYAAFADSANAFHALTGRHDLAERTRVMIEAIAQHLEVRPRQRLLDIGCGDASLLARYAPHAAAAVGTVLTEQERARLAASPDLKGIEFHAASFGNLEAVQGTFDWVIANGCLHFTRTPAGAHRAFDEIVARLAPGGRFWAGELYAKEFRKRRMFGRLEAIRYIRAVHGTPSALGFARHLLRRRGRSGLIIEPPFQSWWHNAKEEIPVFAARHGLRVDGMWSCREMTGDSFYSLQDRYSCLLSRPL